TAGTPDRLGAKGFQPASPHSPPGRVLLQSGQDQSAFVGAPPRCERVSADEPTFAPGAGAPTVGAGSVCLCRSTAPVRKGFSRQAHIRPRGGGSYSRGAGSGCLCRSTAPVRKGCSRRTRIRPRGGGSHNQAGVCRSTAGTRPPRCDEVSAGRTACCQGPRGDIG